MRPPPSWVRMENRPVGEPVLRGLDDLTPLEVWHVCERCGEEIQIPFPILPATWAATAAGFGEAHRGCRR